MKEVESLKNAVALKVKDRKSFFLQEVALAYRKDKVIDENQKEIIKVIKDVIK